MKIWRLILVFFSSWIFLTPLAHAQKTVTFFWQKNDVYDESTRLHVGIVFPQVAKTHYFFEKSDDWHSYSKLANDEPFTKIESTSGWSAGLGIPVDLRIYKNLHFVSGANFVVINGNHGTEGNPNGRALVYHYGEGDGESVVRMQSADKGMGANFPSLEIPLHLKLRSDHKTFKFGDDWLVTRGYLVGGAKYSHLLGASRYYKNENNVLDEMDPPLIVGTRHWSWEAGFGIDFLFTYFKISPEIRFHQSIGNLLGDYSKSDLSTNPYNQAIEKLGIRGIQFSIIIE